MKGDDDDDTVERREVKLRRSTWAALLAAARAAGRTVDEEIAYRLARVEPAAQFTTTSCANCGKEFAVGGFTGQRRDRRFCSNACRTAAWRDRAA